MSAAIASPAALVDGLRERARGAYGTEAAADLLIAHGRWLARPDFRDALVLTDHEHSARPLVSVYWPAVPGFLADAPCSGSEARILALAAELAGTDVARPVVELLEGLDATNAHRVAAAFGHVLTRGGRR